jgi:uncharacterized protein (TIGR03435 family)
MNMLIKRRVLSTLLATCAAAFSIVAAAAHGQVLHPTEPLPSFEVATIKPAQNTAQGFSRPPQNIFRLTNVTARDLVRTAYGLPPGPATLRVLAGPGWIDTNHYNVEGKVPDELFAEMQKTPAQQQRNQMLLMAQSLLADRFKLKVHFEQREMPIYELVVAKNGPKLTPAKEPPPGSDALPPLPANGGTPRPEDLRQGILLIAKQASMEMTAKGQTLDALFIQILFLGLDARPVVNKTGLTGKYDFTLAWTPDQLTRPATDNPAPQNAPDGPSLMTALQEQLGLKLVPTKGLVEVVVIDHIELPSEN